MSWAFSWERRVRSARRFCRVALDRGLRHGGASDALPAALLLASSGGAAGAGADRRLRQRGGGAGSSSCGDAWGIDLSADDVMYLRRRPTRAADDAEHNAGPRQEDDAQHDAEHDARGSAAMPNAARGQTPPSEYVSARLKRDASQRAAGVWPRILSALPSRTRTFAARVRATTNCFTNSCVTASYVTTNCVTTNCVTTASSSLQQASSPAASATSATSAAWEHAVHPRRHSIRPSASGAMRCSVLRRWGLKTLGELAHRGGHLSRVCSVARSSGNRARTGCASGWSTTADEPFEASLTLE